MGRARPSTPSLVNLAIQPVDSVEKIYVTISVN